MCTFPGYARITHLHQTKLKLINIVITCALTINHTSSRVLRYYRDLIFNKNLLSVK